MRNFLVCSTLVALSTYTLAQDPGIQAAQQANQIAIQAAQQANDQAMRAAQTANQNAMIAQQQAAANTNNIRNGAATPKFSVKPGTYASAVTVSIRAGRGEAIYYTTDGWTPTKESKPYTGPVAINSTTTLQAIAVSRSGHRSRLAIAAYVIDGVSAAAVGASSKASTSVADSAPNSAADAGNLLLAKGTPVPLVFVSDLSSKTAKVGDKISLTLGEDLTSGNTVVAKKGTPTEATVTEVDHPHPMGGPGELFFTVDSLNAGDTVIKLHGGEAKEGQDKVTEAAALVPIPVPVALFVRGKDAEIRQGATFTAFVDADTLLPPAK